MAAQPMRQKPPGPPLWLSVPLLVVGIVAFVVSVAGVSDALVHSIYDAPMFHAPGTEQLKCEPGLYAFYVENGSGNISAGSIRVTGPEPANTTVPVQTTSTVQSFSNAGTSFSGNLVFNVTATGTYSITVGSGPADVIVAPTLAAAAERNLGWALGLIAGALAALAGLILLIVGLVQRSRARKIARQFPGPVWGGPPVGPWGPAGTPSPPGGPWGPPGAPSPRGEPWGPPGAPTAPGWPTAPVWPREPSAPGGQPGWSPPGQPNPWPQPTQPIEPTEPTQPGTSAPPGQPYAWPQPDPAPPAPPPDPGASPESGSRPEPVGWPQPSAKPQSPSAP
ncbi:MAG: hypothetical protein ABSD78_17290 [Acidimicrobiales bacterium]